MPSRNYHKFTNLLSGPDEQILNILGNSAAEAFANTGKPKKGFAILTNERVYFSGKCFIRSGRGKSRRQQTYTVGLQDITATGIVNTRSLVCRILVWLFTAFAIAISAWEIYKLLSGDFSVLNIIPLMLKIVLPWLLALVFTLLEQSLSCHLFKISYTGGSIAFDLRWISQAEAEAFQDSLHQACKAQSE